MENANDTPVNTVPNEAVNTDKTVKINLSAEAREALFNIVRSKEGGYAADKVLDAGALLKKLREGTSCTPRKIQTPHGQEVSINIYEGFQSGELAVTPEEIIIARDQFNAMNNWNPDTDLEVYGELKEALK